MADFFRLRFGGCTAAALGAAWLLAQPIFPYPADAQQAAGDNDLALVLAVDVSASIDRQRYEMQMEGIAAALDDGIVQDSLISGPTGESYVTLVEWSNTAVTSIPWTRITSAQDAADLAARIRSLRQPRAEKTCLARSMRAIINNVLATKPGRPSRVIVDVSGDGRDNCDSSAHVDIVMKEFKAANVQVNGLPIIEGDTKTKIVDWYQDHVASSPKGFIVPSKGNADIARAMKVKLLAEISAFTGDDMHVGVASVASLAEPRTGDGLVPCARYLRDLQGYSNSCYMD